MSYLEFQGWETRIDPLYFTSEEGDTYVVRAGPEYELLATNELGEIVMANPAISNGMLVIRTQGHVYGIAEE